MFVNNCAIPNTTKSPTCSNAIQPIINRKHQRQDSVTRPPVAAQAKRRLFLRRDDISDQILMEISQAACSKYIELGLQLDLPYNVIHSRVGAEGINRSEHLKMFYVLQEWKERAASDFSFEVLSKALEDIGLASVAQNYCYTN